MHLSRDIESFLPPPVSSKGRRFILSIGIDRYSRWPRLRNAENDAREVASVFSQLGFQEWCAPLTNEAATFDAIRRLVLVDLPAALGEADSLVVFFAGHGHIETKTIHGTTVRVGYVIPFDGASKQSDCDAWLQLGPWLKDIARLPPRHILVILDCCHSGMALDIPRGSERASPAFEELRLRRSRRVIASALDDQRAMDGGPVVDHSLFTGCLLEGLSGRLGKAAVTGSEIGAYLQRRVTEYPDSKQTPVSGVFDLDDRGELIVPTLTSPADHASRPTSIAVRTRRPRRARTTTRLLSIAAAMIVTSRCSDRGEGATSRATPPPEPPAISPADCQTPLLLPSIAPESSSPASKVCKERGGWLSKPDEGTVNAADCPELFIDDVQVFRNKSVAVLDVRVRNPSEGLVDITRSILDIETANKEIKYTIQYIPESVQAYIDRAASASASEYDHSHTYYINYPRADEFQTEYAFPVARALPASTVDGFRFCGWTNASTTYIVQLTLVYNETCRVHSRCFSVN